MSIIPSPERAAHFLRDVFEALIILGAVTAIVASIAVWVPFLAGRLP